MQAPIPVIASSQFERYVGDVDCRVEFYSRFPCFGIADPDTGSMGIVVFHRSSHERHRDPKGNRPELPTDTSWYEDQSCRFEIDFALPDAALIEFTRQQIKELPGYREVSAWRRQQLEAIQQGLVN